jgi:hypothetical protein
MRSAAMRLLLNGWLVEILAAERAHFDVFVDLLVAAGTLSHVASLLPFRSLEYTFGSS